MISRYLPCHAVYSTISLNPLRSSCLLQIRTLYLPELETLLQECVWLRARMGMDNKNGTYGSYLLSLFLSLHMSFHAVYPVLCLYLSVLPGDHVWHEVMWRGLP